MILGNKAKIKDAIIDQLKSTNYSPNISGFSFDSDGSAEVGNLKVRGNLDVTVFSAQEVKGTNGMLYVSDSSEIVSYSATSPTVAKIEVKDHVFAVNDIIITKSFNGSNVRSGKFQVTGVVNTLLTVNILETPTGVIEPGNPIVRIANTSDTSRQTSILLNPYEKGKIDFIEDNGTTKKVTTRLGNLEGISNLTGNGLYSENAHLTGSFRAGNFYVDTDGAGQLMEGLYWDNTGTMYWKRKPKKLWKKMDGEVLGIYLYNPETDGSFLEVSRKYDDQDMIEFPRASYYDGEQIEVVCSLDNPFLMYNEDGFIVHTTDNESQYRYIKAYPRGRFLGTIEAINGLWHVYNMRGSNNPF